MHLLREGKTSQGCASKVSAHSSKIWITILPTSYCLLAMKYSHKGLCDSGVNRDKAIIIEQSQAHFIFESHSQSWRRISFPTSQVLSFSNVWKAFLYFCVYSLWCQIYIFVLNFSENSMYCPQRAGFCAQPVLSTVSGRLHNAAILRTQKVDGPVLSTG